MGKYLILFNSYSDNARGEYLYIEADNFIDCVKQWLAYNKEEKDLILKGLGAMETVEQAIEYANMFLDKEDEIIDIVKVNYMALYNIGDANKNSVSEN